MADVWEYIGDDKVRYLLGKPGQNNLLLIGVNPSTATPGKPDQTIKKVIKISSEKGYDGWIRVNPLCEEILFSFETQYTPFQKYIFGSISSNCRDKQTLKNFLRLRRVCKFF